MLGPSKHRVPTGVTPGAMPAFGETRTLRPQEGGGCCGVIQGFGDSGSGSKCCWELP